MLQQACAMQLSDLLLAGSVGNYSELLPRELLQTRRCVTKGAGLRFVIADEYLITRVGIRVGQLGRGEYVPHALAALLPDRNFSPTETVKVLIEDLFISHGKLFAGKRNSAAKVIKKREAGRGGSAGMIDQGAINVEENHLVKGAISPPNTGPSACVGEGFHPGQFLSFQKFERSASAGRNVRN